MTAPQPSEPWAAHEAAIMGAADIAALTVTAAAVLKRLTRLWVTLFGGLGLLPSNTPTLAVGTATRPLTGLRSTPGPTPSLAIDFPQLWTDAVDESVDEIIAAMDAATESARGQLPQIDPAKARAYRSARVRQALAPSSIAKRGFLAVQEAVAQPERLHEDVRGQVVGELVAQHTDEQLAQLDELGDEWVAFWVCERDACVRCLAYSGLYVGPGQEFPGGRTMGPRWKSVVGRPDFRGPGWREGTDDAPGEGMHPRCRCELRIVKRRGVRTIAAAAKREALRSAAKGWARPTEGDSVRVVAAKTALNRAAKLPDAVIAEARRRLRHPRTFRRAVPSPNR